MRAASHIVEAYLHMTYLHCFFLFFFLKINDICLLLISTPVIRVAKQFANVHSCKLESLTTPCLSSYKSSLFSFVYRHLHHTYQSARYLFKTGKNNSSKEDILLLFFLKKKVGEYSYTILYPFFLTLKSTK